MLSNAVILYRIKKKKIDKGYGFLSFARIYKKQLLDAGLDAVKTASKENFIKQVNFQEIKLQAQ